MLLAGTRAAAAFGHSGALCFSRFNAAWELAALKHPTPSSLIRCDARHALRLVKTRVRVAFSRRRVRASARCACGFLLMRQKELKGRSD